MPGSRWSRDAVNKYTSTSIWIYLSTCVLVYLILITMPILSIDHVQIAMPPGQEDQARTFYISVLGFKEIPKPAELASRGGAWFQSGNVQLHLGVETDFRPAHKAHPALIVSDLDAMIVKVKEAGYETDTSQPPLEGYKRAHVFDPFGNRIELMEKL
jgi:catechol 2,3-dioxygenase-like lactoylglutathione lyase family enzyme